MLVRVEKLLDEAGKTAAKTSASDPPKPDTAAVVERRSLSPTALRRRRLATSPRPAAARTSSVRLDLHHASGADHRLGRRPRLDLDDRDARAPTSARSRSAPGPRGRRPAPPTSTPTRAPRSPAAANCRSAPATASPLPPTPTTRTGRSMAAATWSCQRRHARGAVLDADAVRHQGTAGRQFAAALRLHQPGNHPRRRRHVRDTDGLALARRQLAAHRRHRALRADAAAVRYAGRRRHAHAARRADAPISTVGCP